MDFRTPRERPCEQVLFEHCYGYPLGGTFIAIDHCYDIPRILHCHVNPANRRFIDGGHHRDVIDAVMARKTFCYWIDHTDNAQLMDVFTFGTWGGIYLGPATYGQLTNSTSTAWRGPIHKLGDSSSTALADQPGIDHANAGAPLADIHPFVWKGKGTRPWRTAKAFRRQSGADQGRQSHDSWLCTAGTVDGQPCRMPHAQLRGR